MAFHHGGGGHHGFGHHGFRHQQGFGHHHHHHHGFGHHHHHHHGFGHHHHHNGFGQGFGYTYPYYGRLNQNVFNTCSIKCIDLLILFYLALKTITQ